MKCLAILVVALAVCQADGKYAVCTVSTQYRVRMFRRILNHYDTKDSAQTDQLNGLFHTSADLGNSVGTR